MNGGLFLNDCIFCKIIEGSIPSTTVYETEDLLAFRDIQPVAPTHVLVVPKIHIRNVLELAETQGDLANRLMAGIREVARITGVSESGFRVITNTGQEGQQTVDHLHFHVIGGRQLEWKM